MPRRAGDAFQVDLGGGVVRRAVLESCDAPNALTFMWWSGDDDPGLVRIRLDAVGEQTRLTMQHDRLRPHRLIQYGGGWEQNLVALADVLRAGSSPAPSAVERTRRWELLSAHPLRVGVDLDAPVNEVWDAWAGADGLA